MTYRVAKQLVEFLAFHTRLLFHILTIIRHNNLNKLNKSAPSYYITHMLTATNLHVNKMRAIYSIKFHNWSLKLKANHRFSTPAYHIIHVKVTCRHMLF